MKKLIILTVMSLILILVNFSPIFAGGPKQITEKQKINIEKKINRIYDKIKGKHGKEEAQKVFKKVGQKILNIDKGLDEALGHKKINKELYNLVGKIIYKLVISNQNNESITVKTLGKGITIKQNKYGIGYTSIEVYGKEIFRDLTLSRAFCNPYSIYDCFDLSVNTNIYNVNDSDSARIKIDALRGFWISDKEFLKIEPKLIILGIGFYEGGITYLIDTKNKIIINQSFRGIENIKKGRSGIYFVSRGYGFHGLFLLTPNNIIKKIYGGKYKEDLIGDEYELLTDKRIKLFLSGDKSYEKIITID